MHTEEDTFNRLRRIPFEEMRLMIRELNQVGQVGKGRRVAALKALDQNGWTEDEYQGKLAKVINAERLL